MPITFEEFFNSLSEGSTEVALPGSGASNPPGLEAVMTYNGVTIGDESTIDKYRVKRIDFNKDVRDKRDSRPDRDGEITYKSYFGGMNITIDGTIMAHNVNKLRDMHQALKYAFASLEEQPLYFIRDASISYGNDDVFIDCKAISDVKFTEEQNNASNFYRDFQINLRASKPYFVSANLYTDTIAVYGFQDDYSTNSFDLGLYNLSKVNTFLTIGYYPYSDDNQGVRLMRTRDVANRVPKDLVMFPGIEWNGDLTDSRQLVSVTPDPNHDKAVQFGFVSRYTDDSNCIVAGFIKENSASPSLSDLNNSMFIGRGVSSTGWDYYDHYTASYSQTFGVETIYCSVTFPAEIYENCVMQFEIEGNVATLELLQDYGGGEDNQVLTCNLYDYGDTNTGKGYNGVLTSLFPFYDDNAVAPFDLFSWDDYYLTMPSGSVRTYVNDGSYKAYPKIVFNGPLYDTIVENQVFLPGETDYRRIVINGLIGETVSYTYDVENNTLFDSAGVNRFNQLDIQSRDIVFPVGESQIAIADFYEDPDSSVEISYRKTWQ